MLAAEVPFGCAQGLMRRGETRVGHKEYEGHEDEGKELPTAMEVPLTKPWNMQPYLSARSKKLQRFVPDLYFGFVIRVETKTQLP
jgi:hypothetical protein